MSLNRTIGSSRHVRACCLLLALVVLGGCRLCQDCGDLDYPTYGGAWERTIRDRGRVGSVFDPAGAQSPKLSNREVVEEGRKRADSETDDIEGTPGDDETPNPDSPSDDQRQNDLDKLRDLRLEDINTQQREFVPPDL